MNDFKTIVCANKVMDLGHEDKLSQKQSSHHQWRKPHENATE
jgi:hypothetical protein